MIDIFIWYKLLLFIAKWFKIALSFYYNYCIIDSMPNGLSSLSQLKSRILWHYYLHLSFGLSRYNSRL
jgi:hypothetical protein